MPPTPTPTPLAELDPAEMYDRLNAALAAIQALLANTRYRVTTTTDRLDRLNHVRADLELLAGGYPGRDT